MTAERLDCISSILFGFSKYSLATSCSRSTLSFKFFSLDFINIVVTLQFAKR